MNVLGSIVNVYEFVRGSDEYSSKKVCIGQGCLIHFGISSERFQNGFVEIFSTAVVRMNDNTVKNVPVENIVFRDDASYLK